ncbi:MAG: hypothetical protein WAX69_27035 [Victivallales bacterium]
MCKGEWNAGIRRRFSPSIRAFTFPPCLVHEIGMHYDPAEDAEDRQDGKYLEVSPSSEMPYEEKGE